MTKAPIRIQIITAAGCHKCVDAKRAVIDTVKQVQGAYQIEVQEVNLLEHPEVAAEYGIMATPAMIINGKLAFVGRVEERALREKLDAAKERA